MAEEHFRIKENLIVRDEHQLFDCGWYLVADQSKPASWLMSRQAYDLLNYLMEPRSPADLEAYRIGLPYGAPLADQTKMGELLQALRQMGVVLQVPADAPAVEHDWPRPELDGWRYKPTSAPVSSVLYGPMAPELFAQIIDQFHAAGVLGVEFRGGADLPAFLAQQKELLKGFRGALVIRLQAATVDRRAGDDLLELAIARQQPLAVVLAVDSIDPAALQSAGAILRERKLQYYVTYRFGNAATAAQLKELARTALNLGASYFQIRVDPETAGEQPLDMTGLTDVLNLLREVQDGFPTGRVQVRLLHAPIPRPYMQPDMIVKRILSANLGGCVVGTLIPIPPASAPQPAGLHFPTPNELAAMGPELPPNCCQAGIMSLVVDHDGTVYPCDEAIGMAELAIGSLAQSSLTEIWASEDWQGFRGGWDLYQLPGCYACRYYIGCGWRRCRVHAQKQLGNRLAPMPMCVRCAKELNLSQENLTALLGEGYQDRLVGE